MVGLSVEVVVAFVVVDEVGSGAVSVVSMVEVDSVVVVDSVDSVDSVVGVD